MLCLVIQICRRLLGLLGLLGILGGLNGLQRNWELKMSWECLGGKIMEILGGNI